MKLKVSIIAFVLVRVRFLHGQVANNASNSSPSQTPSELDAARSVCRLGRSRRRGRRAGARRALGGGGVGGSAGPFGGTDLCDELGSRANVRDGARRADAAGRVGNVGVHVVALAEVVGAAAVHGGGGCGEARVTARGQLRGQLGCGGGGGSQADEAGDDESGELHLDFWFGCFVFLGWVVVEVATELVC